MKLEVEFSILTILRLVTFNITDLSVLFNVSHSFHISFQNTLLIPFSGATNLCLTILL